MKNKQKKVFLILTGILINSYLIAQTTVSSAGDDVSSMGGSISYSVGQVASKSLTGTSGSLYEGVQQSFEIYVITGIEGAKGINLNVSEYPNPVDKYLILKVEGTLNLGQNSLNYQFYDESGKILISDKINNYETRIVTENLKSKTYFLKVINSNSEIKTFKIIKK